MSAELETPRLLVRELQEDDLEAALAVYASNPGYLASTEGSGGEPGRYDLAMLERDVVVARMTPGRHLAVAALRQSGDTVALLDWLEENDSDGLPWIGLVIVRADCHRRRLATELVAELMRLLRERGCQRVRAGVLASNAAGRSFAESLGFETVSEVEKRLVASETVLVVERAL